VKLVDFVSRDRVLLPLGGASLTEAAEELLAALEASGALRDADRVRQRLREARPEDVVTSAGRAFLVHFRGDAVAALRVALGIAPAPLPRDAEDPGATRARVVVLVVAPPRDAARHLQLVRAFARLFAHTAAIEAMLGAADATALLELEALTEFTLPEELTVRDLMTERPRTTSPEMPLRDAAREMLQAGLSALPVVDEDGRLLGLLSERELMRHLVTTALLAGSSSRFTPPGAQGRRTVRDVMTRQVLCVAPEQSVAEVASLMTNKDVERVPVVREGQLVGFLTRGDIVRKLIGP
jgi:CBS domain-containing protein/mannitol/fructose-specific phosphotransferase system IIA component (Ntr-type)